MRYGVLLMCLLAANLQAAELYRSIDSSGKVHYSDRPLQGAEDVEEVRADKAPTPDDSLPYETERARKNFPVTLYVFDGCGDPCKQGRDFLAKRGVPFEEKNLTTQEQVDALQKASGGSGAPTLSIGKTWLVGFLAEKWNKELDFAGYPRTAPYRPHAAVAPPAQAAQ